MAAKVNNKMFLLKQILPLLEVSDSSSDSEEEFNDLPILTWQAQEKNRIPKIQNYVEKVVYDMSDYTFKSNFRITRHSVQEIERMIREDCLTPPPVARCIDLHKQILMTLWILATPESFRSVAERFGVSKSTLWISCDATWTAIARLSPKIIKWPTISEMLQISEEFSNIATFPGVIGCIDGTHIPIKAPKEHPETYVDRKSVISIVLQGVVNNKLEFTDCYAGEVGSVHDAKVLRKSNLGQNLSNWVPECYHLLGDPAYPLQLNLMRPFRDNGHLTIQQLNFNKKLSQTRSTVERAFGLLKGKWRRLKYLDMNRTDLIPTVIMACCVLHNIARFEHEDDYDDDYVDDGNNYENDDEDPD